jgi:hypothetical protein
MAKEILFAEWRNQHERVNYPFADAATMKNADGATIDPNLFLDARLYPVGGDETLYLRRVEVTEEYARFHLAVGDTEIAYGHLDLLAVPANGEVPVYDTYGRPAGVFVSTQDRLTAVPGLFSGETIFPEEASHFAPSVVVPMPDVGVRGFVTDDGDMIFGPAILVGEQGIVLSVESGVIRVDALGNPFAKHEDCQDQDPLSPYCPVKTINGISPDENGDFKLSIGGNSALDNIFRIVQLTPGVLQILPAKSLGVERSLTEGGGT